LIASGTTPKMIAKETDCRMIGYGAMLCEGWVGVTSLIAASALFPADYFAINVSPEKFSQLGMSVVHLPELAQEVGEQVAGRPGGAVSLAVGMAQIFSHLPGLRGWMDIWYHFAILFEALFILTTIDSGTRVARYLLQEIFGQCKDSWKQTWGRPDWLPGSLISTLIVVFAWVGFIWTGSISTIWPLFGIANQLLASISLLIGTLWIVRLGKLRYAWTTFIPFLFVSITTVTAGVENIWNNIIHKLGQSHLLIGYFNSAVTLLMIGAVVVMSGIAIGRVVQIRQSTPKGLLG